MIVFLLGKQTNQVSVTVSSFLIVKIGFTCQKYDWPENKEVFSTQLFYQV